MLRFTAAIRQRFSQISREVFFIKIIHVDKITIAFVNFFRKRCKQAITSCVKAGTH